MSLIVYALLDHAEEGVEYEDMRLVCRHTCEFMEWALVLASRFVWRYHREANGEPLGFRCEKNCTALYGLVSPHSCINDRA